MIVKERAEGYGGELGEMRNHADGVVVCWRRAREGGRRFFEELEESGDARVALGGRGISWDGRVGDERVGRVAEEVGVGLRDAGGFASGHGVTPRKSAVAGEEKFRGGLRDAKLGAAGVGDEACLGARRAISGRRSSVTPMGSAM